MRFSLRAHGLRAVLPMALTGALVLTVAPAAVAPASVTPAAAADVTEADQIVRIAKAQIGDPYRYGAEGPGSFDCSGLVLYAYTKAGDAKVLGNWKYRSARAMYTYLRDKGLASRSNPKKGDLVVWGNGSHIGIYIGDGKAISALTSGVRVHGVHAVTASFTAYLHTGMNRVSATDGTVTTTSTSTRYTDGRVNLRTGPGTNYTIITTLADRTKLTVLAQAYDSFERKWIKVSTGGRTGWVAKWLTDAS